MFLSMLLYRSYDNFDYWYGNELKNFVVLIMMACLVLGALGIVQQVMFGLAAYNDAKAKGNGEPLMWGLLIGFLGLIPGIVYLCLRNSAANKMIYCQKCGFVHPISLPYCPQCGVSNPYSMPFNNPMTPEYARKAKRDLIIAIVLFAALCVLSVVFFVMMFSMMWEIGYYY